MKINGAVFLQMRQIMPVQFGTVSCFTCLMHQNKYHSKRTSGYKPTCRSEILVQELPLPELRIL